MSKLLINKIAVALAVKSHLTLQAKQLTKYWAKTPSNLAYRVRCQTGWNVKAWRDHRTGRIHFERFPSKPNLN